MSVQTGANAAFYIATTAGAVPANQAAYEALTWVEVEQIETMPTFGDTTTEVTFQGLSDGRVQKLKGTRDAGSSDLGFAFLDTIGSGSPQTGQYLLLAASEDDTTNNYAFKVVYSDQTTGSPYGTGSTRYFAGLVGGFSEGGFGANDVVMITAPIRVNSPVIRVART